MKSHTKAVESASFTVGGFEENEEMSVYFILFTKALKYSCRVEGTLLRVIWSEGVGGGNFDVDQSPLFCRPSVSLQLSTVVPRRFNEDGASIETSWFLYHFHSAPSSRGLSLYSRNVLTL